MKVSLDRHSQGLSIFFATVLALGISGCTGLMNTKLFKERAAETPAPNEQIIDKSFFVDETGKPKTFICGWAPEIGRGEFGEELLLPLVNTATHCNLEWKITEDYLVAIKMNPSFPNDRSRWAEMLKIPIQKHFYYEREKDAHGRETNRWIENDQRSHWSARPKMRLNLAATNILNMGIEGWGSFNTTSIDNVEWDMSRGFLGFSMNMVYANFAGTVESYQGRFRVNFMEFKHDPTFKKTPYNQENSKYLNALHIMGRKIEGMEPELYAAHWDLRKPVNVYINGVPKELEKDVVGAVYKWNKQLEDAGIVEKGARPFQPIIKQLKEPFDLRYPSINYITDRRISAYAPLGVGEAVADVSNGQMLWGSVTMFGGALEGYINAYTPSGSADSSDSAVAPSAAFSPFAVLSAMMPSSFKPAALVRSTSRQELLQNVSIDQPNYLTSEIARLGLALKSKTDKDTLAGLKAQLQSFQSKDPNLNQIVADILANNDAETQKATSFFQGNTTQSVLGADTSATTGTGDADLAKATKNDAQMAALLKQKNADKRRDLLKTLIHDNAFYIEQEYNLNTVAPLLMGDPAQKTRTYPEMLDSVIMHLTLHEFGHFIGLGHQFKENIVPDRGTVPSRYVDDLSAKATEANEFAEETTEMGYRHGRTEMMVPADQLKPGAHDELVLRYLYKGEYSAYDQAHDEWAYGTVPPSGKIPDVSVLKDKDGKQTSMRTAYFPQCNDVEASLATDPFCNRWDRGSSAVDIVKSYFGYINNNLLYSLYSLSGGGGNAEGVEGNLWYRALDHFSRVRIFYDEMRRRLRTDPYLSPLWEQLRTDKSALLEFSGACQTKNPNDENAVDPSKITSPILIKIFKDKKIVDLCRANALALNEFSFFMNLPAADYTKIDNTNRYISGGMFAGDTTQNWGHIFGSWYQMSNLPLKISSLYMLMTANPPMMYGPYMVPNWSYDSADNRYLYRTLYPHEYTRMISDSIQHNMRFAATGTDDTTTMGRSILSAGGFLEMQKFTNNDSAHLPTEFNELLDQQSQFSYGMVAVMISATQPDPVEHVATDHYKKFTATIYDFFTGKSTTASDVFILPKGRVLVWKHGMFLFPITKLKFYQGTNAYVVAYKVDYDYQAGDELYEESVKTALTEQHDTILNTCMKGFDGNGLLNYFGAGSANTANAGDDNAETCDPSEHKKYCAFQGFHIPPGIDTEVGKEKIGLFYKSIDDAFWSYEGMSRSKIPDHYPKSMSTVCDESIRGVGQISAAAALINGYWLGITADYIEK